MKASFSLSSLQASETPEKCVKPRMYNSLTKNRKETKIWRRSWGSSASDQKDDFWSALQANYNYIMDNQLIDKCQVRCVSCMKEFKSTHLPLLPGSQWRFDDRSNIHLVTERILCPIFRTLFLVE